MKLGEFLEKRIKFILVLTIIVTILISISSMYLFKNLDKYIAKYITSDKQEVLSINSIIDSEYVKITGYNPVPEQTQGNPLETASGEMIDPDNLSNTVAISRDLEERFSMGDTIHLDCNCPYKGTYKINDRLGSRARNQIDILTWRTDILHYGKIVKKITLDK